MIRARTSFSAIRRCWPVLSVLTLCLPASARTFTSDKGVQIEAEVKEVTDTHVVLVRADGKNFRTEITRFQPADQEYLREWKATHRVLKLAMDGAAQSGPTRKAVDFEGTGQGNDNWYRFTLTNKSGADVGPLARVRIEYVLFPEAGKPAVGADGKPGGTCGAADLGTIAPGMSGQADTAKVFVPSPRTSSTGTRGIPGGGSATVGVSRTGSLAGAFCEVFINGKLVMRQAWGKPPADAEKALAAWREQSAEKPAAPPVENP